MGCDNVGKNNCVDESIRNVCMVRSYANKHSNVDDSVSCEFHIMFHLCKMCVY